MDTVIQDGDEENNSIEKENGVFEEFSEKSDTTPANDGDSGAVTAASDAIDGEEIDESEIQENIVDSTERAGEYDNFRHGNGPRQRGKPFNGPQSNRGRGGGGGSNQFHRGGGGGGRSSGANGGRFSNGNDFESNWQGNDSPNFNHGPPLELWVETKTDDGKSYFYHAITRETTWTKPDGMNIKVMTQQEIEEMNQKNQQMQNNQQGNSEGKAMEGMNGEDNRMGAGDMPNKGHQPPMGLLPQPPNHQQQPSSQQQQMPPQQLQHQQQQQHHHPPPNMHQQPPPFFGGMHPPNFAQPPFGMPPPGYGSYGGPTPWGMPWNQHMAHHGHVPPAQEKPAKSLIIKPGVIDPAVIARAAEWSEHRAPDGRPYYYHAARGESVWEKPQAIRDMEAARMAAHSGASPQQTTAQAQQPPPHMMPPVHMHMPPGGGGGVYDPSMAYNAMKAAGGMSMSTDPMKAAVNAAAAFEKETKEKKAMEEKKKKEEEKKNAAAANKPVDKSRPISSTPIAGTPWCVVWTGDGRVFFYNPSTRTSVWERPEDLLDREDVDKAVNNTPEQLKGTIPSNNTNSTSSTISVTSTIPTQNQKSQNDIAKVVSATKSTTNTAASTAVTSASSHAAVIAMDQDDDDDEVIRIHSESESSIEEVPTKKLKPEVKLSKKSSTEVANEAAVEAEVRAAKERALVPLETRIKQFKEMLREKDVSAFSTWEKELHKIVFDPRYLLLTSKERKQVFEKYVKDRAEEERKEKRNKMRQKRDEFRKLMEQSNLHGKSTFSDFSQRHGKDDRYKAIEKVRERESLFNEYIVDVRRQEKEDKIHKREQVRKDFIEMLRDRSDIDRHCRWQDIKKKLDSDSRYRAVENSMLREDYFLEYMRMLKEEKRKQKERERERERKERRQEKSEHKEKDRAKERSRERERGGTGRDKEKDKEKESRDKKKHEDMPQEEGENQDIKNTSGSEADETERLQKERDRQMRAEQSIREREKEVQRTLAGHLRDRDKEREHHKRDEAIRHFSALLADLVRNPDLTWKEVKRQLRKDHRWELVEALDRDDKEKLFNSHIDALMKKKREKFREMLDEVNTLELTSSWKEIKKLIKEDPRYLKYNSDKCEREYRDYIKDRTLNAKTALRELLQECKLITHKTIELVKDNSNHLKEIEEILKNDKRYLVLNHLAEERSTIVVQYLEELHKRGPPPPPTACESTRRNK